MSIKLKKISATIAAVFVIFGGVLTSSSKVKASGYNPYMPPIGAPSYPYYAPSAYPTRGVPAFKVPVNQLNKPLTVNMPGPVYLPANYKFSFVLYGGVPCPFMIRNGMTCYQIGDRFYPVYRI